MQIIEAENDELIDIGHAGMLPCKKLQDRVPVERHVSPGISHFEIHRAPASMEAFRLQIEWFDRHLKGIPTSRGSAPSGDWGSAPPIGVPRLQRGAVISRGPRLSKDA